MIKPPFLFEWAKNQDRSGAGHPRHKASFRQRFQTGLTCLTSLIHDNMRASREDEHDDTPFAY
ncbi:MAG: hypothetical protein EA374_04350 [Acholeplasmatales bacterium]|nr:MAG: hypothetical protein EA374_04350 [Acholeplasmatales bacterium]